jgi:hypothetical protein
VGTDIPAHAHQLQTIGKQDWCKKTLKPQGYVASSSYLEDPYFLKHRTSFEKYAEFTYGTQKINLTTTSKESQLPLNIIIRQ